MRRGLEYLCGKIVSDPHLSDVYRHYIRLIRANCLLYLAILANTGRLFDDAQKYLREAVAIDVRMLANPRLWRVARRTLFRLQP
ncbi:MAG: hypothetical protein LC776_16195 [Acidobacteria bacterium]|nr:hypothetical protein [Acidobacteriota bacterium]